eukprot:3933326-Rhodomonas_salina.1
MLLRDPQDALEQQHNEKRGNLTEEIYLADKTKMEYERTHIDTTCDYLTFRERSTGEIVMKKCLAQFHQNAKYIIVSYTRKTSLSYPDEKWIVLNMWLPTGTYEIQGEGPGFTTFPIFASDKLPETDEEFEKSYQSLLLLNGVKAADP